MPRYFTVDEANAMLDILRPLAAQILVIRQSIIDKRPDVWPVIEKAAGNGGGRVASEVTEDFKRLDALIRQVLAFDIQIKDINTGLFDFLALRENREVLLCWRYNEASILFWHELDAGFSGRQPI